MFTGDKRHFFVVVFLILLAVALSVSTAVQTVNLTATRGLLTVAYADLSQTQSTLVSTQGELTSTKDSLAITRADYAQSEADLAKTKSSLTDTRNELTAAKNSLARSESNLALTRSDLVQAQVSLSSVQTELSNARTQYDRATTGYGYILNDPTYSQMMSFVNSDQTDKHAYDENLYNCYNFATDTANNAKAQRIRAGVVYIIYRDGAHAAIAFNTLDRGIVYFEPQTDEQVNLAVGKRYYLEVIPAPGYYAPAPAYDDTVLNFTINW